MTGAVLSAERLGIAYDGVPVLHDVSLHLHPGERVAIIGRSGSGKSGLARLLAGLPPPGAAIRGTLRWDGGHADLSTLRPAARRSRIGAGIAWLPQDAQAALNPFLRLGTHLSETRRDADPAALFAAVGLDPALLRHYPHQVSGGQAQRAALACALAQQPRVLIADEPTSALDSATATAVLELIDATTRSRGLALILVTHDLDAAARCDRLLVLDAGGIVEAGPPASVLSRPCSQAASALVRAAQRLGAGCSPSTP